MTDTVERAQRAAHDALGLNLLSQLVRGQNALRQLEVFPCNNGEHAPGCECFWEQCEQWAESTKWITCAKCGQKRAASTVADSDSFLCRYCFSTESVATPSQGVREAARAITKALADAVYLGGRENQEWLTNRIISLVTEQVREEREWLLLKLSSPSMKGYESKSESKGWNGGWNAAVNHLIAAVKERAAIDTEKVKSQTCPHCLFVDCQCSDFDVSPDMGAKG